MYKNSEGYVDPTAGVAMATVKREENAELNDRNHYHNSTDSSDQEHC